MVTTQPDGTLDCWARISFSADFVNQIVSGSRDMAAGIVNHEASKAAEELYETMMAELDKRARERRSQQQEPKK